MNLKWRIFLNMLALAAMFSGLGAAAWAGERPQVRVGFFQLPGFQELAGNGARGGYSYEYIQAVAAWANWDLEFVDASFAECLELLADGRIDVMGGLHYTESRGREMLFPEIQAGVNYATLLVGEHSPLAFEEFSAFGDELTVGIIRGDATEADLSRYSQANGLRLDIKYYDTDERLSAALASGAVEAVLAPSLYFRHKKREVARFASRPFYFAVNRNRPELWNQLNQAQTRLLVADPLFPSRLMAKYLAMEPHQTVLLSGPEEDYLATGPVVRVVYDAQAVPLEYLDTQSGAIAGFAAGLLDNIGRRTGLNFSFRPARSYAEARRLLAEGEVDLMCGFEADYPWMAQWQVRATRPYVSLPMVRVVNPAGRESTVVADDYLAGFWASRLTAGRSVVRVATVEDALRRLTSGLARETYLNVYAADYYLNDPRYAGLMSAPLPGYLRELTLGVSPRAPAELLGILNKSLDSLSGLEVTDLLVESLAASKPLTLKTFIMKNPVAAQIFLLTIIGAVIAALLIVMWYRGQSLKKIREQLFVDPLTRHWTGQKFRAEAQKALRASPEVPYAIVYLDIIEFKYINEAHGYPEGDRVLRIVGERLLENLRPGEMSARLMADHFIMLLRGEPSALGARVRGLIQDLGTIRPTDCYPLSFSAGIYSRLSGGGDISAMLDRANYARSAAKRALPDMVVFYDESLRESIRQEKSVEAVMRTALARGEFVPYFQPKVDMFTGRMVGAEALVRWIRPGGEIVPPDRFIPLFERNGFIVELDLYIYEQVCLRLHRWLMTQRVVPPISCNFSRLHIRDQAFCRRLKKVADRYQVPTRYLDLEITESVAMENVDLLVTLMQRLRQAGFIITIDDFGAGYSSLGLLQKLPANVLKLDRAFVSTVAHPTNRVVVQAVVDIAEKLNMQVVCEGVETREQVEVLQSVNCSIAQGFFYAPPLSTPEFERYLARFEYDAQVWGEMRPV